MSRPAKPMLIASASAEECVEHCVSLGGIEYHRLPRDLCPGCLREERDDLREALDDAAGWLEGLCAGSESCGDPDEECPLQDCRKPDDIAGAAARHRALLAGKPTTEKNQ